MLATKNSHINNLNLAHSNTISDINQWVDIRSIDTPQNSVEEYRNIFSEFTSTNKWVLMVSPEQDTLEELSKRSDIGSSKILRVHSNKVEVSIKNIEIALRKGNCSVVVLCNTQFSETELSTLSEAAKKGSTPCIILENNYTIH